MMPVSASNPATPTPAPTSAIPIPSLAVALRSLSIKQLPASFRLLHHHYRRIVHGMVLILCPTNRHSAIASTRCPNSNPRLVSSLYLRQSQLTTQLTLHPAAVV